MNVTSITNDFFYLSVRYPWEDNHPNNYQLIFVRMIQVAYMLIL